MCNRSNIAVELTEEHSTELLNEDKAMEIEQNQRFSLQLEFKLSERDKCSEMKEFG